MLRRSLLLLSESPSAKKLLTGTPLTRSVSRRFVPGERVADVVAVLREANAEGLRGTVNYLGEAVTNEAAARAAAATYIETLDRIREEDLDAGISVKFTQMGQDIDEGFLQENLQRVLVRAKAAGAFVRFDMESSSYTQRTLDAFEALWNEGWRDIGVVLQAYLKRTAGDVERMIELGAPVRLCKGAYAEPADVAFQDMAEIRRHFVALLHRLMKDGRHPAIATHDPLLIDAARSFAEAEGIAPDRFEFQMLYGVRRDLQQELIAEGYAVRAYIPFGEQWYPYLMRRLAERPENVMFMVGSVVKESPLGVLWPGGRKRARANANGAPPTSGAEAEPG